VTDQKKDARRTRTSRTHETGTDPRYHAAFQRGYDGPAPERGAKAEERFRRPRRGDEAAARPRTTVLPTSEPVLDPARSLGFEAPAERTATLPAEELSERPIEDPVANAEPEWSPLDVRVPVVLVVMGVLLLVLPLAFVWSSSSVVYGGSGSAGDQVLMYFFNFLPGPSITVGLLSIGAALALRVARR
jgi:hypothetical protein